jgi:hypothetical protein
VRGPTLFLRTCSAQIIRRGNDGIIMSAHYLSLWSLIQNKTFRRMDSVSVFSWHLLSWAHVDTASRPYLRTPKPKLYYYRRFVGKSVTLSGHHLGPAIYFSFSSMEIIYRYLRFPRMGRPLWREDGSVIRSYKFYWALPELSLSGPSPAEPGPIT